MDTLQNQSYQSKECSRFRELLKPLGFDTIGAIPVSTLSFHPSLLSLCQQNACGNYGKNYTCPPLAGEIEVLMEKARGYQTLLLFQKIYPLEDSFDIEGMTQANQDFNALVARTGDLCRKTLGSFLLLGAGGCRLCTPCRAVFNQPCAHPDQAYASLESYGIQVSELAAQCAMNYINGPNTVTYFGAVLYGK